MKLVLLFLIFTSNLFAASEQGFVRGFPTQEKAKQLQSDELFQAALDAYRFWYPTVSWSRQREGFARAGINIEDSYLYMKASPANVLFTPNADTPYATTMVNLKNGPVVVEIPPGPFIGIIIDIHQNWIADIGLPSKEGAKGGKYLIVPPGFKGEIPSGFNNIAYSKSNFVFPGFRILPQNGDADAALGKLKDIKIHHLSNPVSLLKQIDMTDKKFDVTLVSIEDKFAYWTEIKDVIDNDPLIEEFQPMYGLLAKLGIEKGKKFAPDANMKALLEEAAKTGKEQMLVSAYASSRPDKMVWKDRKWEWVGLVSDNGNFRTPSGAIDLDARERWFAQAIGTSPAMFSRKEGAGSLYWLGLKDNRGEYLDGGKTYKLTVPGPIPAKLFWSVSVYDNESRAFIQTPQNLAAIRSLFELKDMKTASYDLYFGPKAPQGKENQWVQTLPGKGWFAYFRIYGPTKDAFNGKWKPGDFEEVNLQNLKQAQEATK